MLSRPCPLLHVAPRISPSMQVMGILLGIPIAPHSLFLALTRLISPLPRGRLNTGGHQIWTLLGPSSAGVGKDLAGGSRLRASYEAPQDCRWQGCIRWSRLCRAECVIE